MIGTRDGETLDDEPVLIVDDLGDEGPSLPARKGRLHSSPMAGYGEYVYQVVVREDGNDSTDMHKQDRPLEVGDLRKLRLLGWVKITEIVEKPKAGSSAGRAYAERVPDPRRR